MEIRTRQRVGRVPALRGMEPGSASMGNRRRPRAVVAVALVAVCTGLVTVAISARTTPSGRPGHAVAEPPEAAPGVPTGAARLETGVGWIDGLATGLILPTDVTGRLWQRPRLARVIIGAWSDLASSGGRAHLRRAVGWLDGLTTGLIIPPDVTSRLEGQDPRAAEALLAAWSDLNGLATANCCTPGSQPELRSLRRHAPGVPQRPEGGWSR